MLAAVTELHYGEQTLLGLNLTSARRYPDFAAELTELTGHDLGYRRCGTLAVALDADDRAHLRELHTLQRQSGLESEWLSGRECRRLEPMLAPGVRGGLRVDGDHQIDPRRLTRALLAACERAGVVFHRAWAERLRVVRDRAAGHYRNGVLLTPVTGDAMAHVLTTGELPEVARPFTPGRFLERVEQPA